MVGSLLIGVVTTGVIRSEVLDWIPSFWGVGKPGGYRRIKCWNLIALGRFERQAMQKQETPGVFHVRTGSAWDLGDAGMRQLHPFHPLVLWGRQRAGGASLGCTSRDGSFWEVYQGTWVNPGMLSKDLQIPELKGAQKLLLCHSKHPEGCTYGMAPAPGCQPLKSPSEGRLWVQDPCEPSGVSVPHRTAELSDAPLIKSDGNEWDVTPAYMIQLESSHYTA